MYSYLGTILEYYAVLVVTRKKRDPVRVPRLQRVLIHLVVRNTIIAWQPGQTSTGIIIRSARRVRAEE
jgi:hypothetical protein